MRATKHREKIAIWGAAGHALVVANIAQLLGRFQVVGHIDDVSPARSGESFAGTSVIGGQNKLAGLFAQGVRKMVVAVGDCAARLRIAEVANQHGFTLISLVHPSAVVAHDVAIGAGTVVAAAAVINPGSVIGKNVIINTSASVDHECVIADGVHIAPGAHLGGRVTIGEGSWIGLGASIKDRISVGSRSTIGTGSVVVKDIPDGVVAYGCPARIERQMDWNSEI